MIAESFDESLEKLDKLGEANIKARRNLLNIQLNLASISPQVKILS